jgi:hypothetical protein
MKVLALLLLCSTITISLTAQGWSRSFEIYPANEITMRHCLIKDTIIVKSFNYCHNSTDQCSFISKFDTAGYLISSKEFYKPKRSIQLGAYSDIIEVENKLVTSGDDSWDNDTLNKQTQHLYKITKSFDSIQRIQIPIPDSVYQYGGNVLYYEKEKLIITEALRYDPKAKDKNITHINAINENNEVIWSYNYKIPEPTYKMTDVGEIVKNSDTSFITSMRIGGSYIQYFSMNTKGKLLWEYTEKVYVEALIGDPSTYKPMIAPADGTDIVRAWFYSDPNFNKSHTEISKLSNKGVMIWQHKFPFTKKTDSIQIEGKKIWQLIKTKNGDYIGVGEALYLDYRKDVLDGIAYDVGYAYRVDNNGNVLWEHYIADIPKQKYGYQAFYNVAEGDDGSIYLSGIINDSIPNKPGSKSNDNIWLVKLGPDGCITPGCKDSLVQVSTTKILNKHPYLLTVFPNPGSDQVTIGWNDVPSPPKTLEIRTMAGQLIRSDHIDGNGGNATIDVSYLQGGMYLLNLRGRDWQSMPVKWVKKGE